MAIAYSGTFLVFQTIGPEYELPIEMKIGLKENSDLCGAAVDPRRHREPVLRQGGYRLGQEDERQQAEMKIEQLSVNLY